jgi:hypothetical protein
MHWGCGGAPYTCPNPCLCLVINLTCGLYIIKIHVNMTLGRNYRGAVGKKKNIGEESF